MMKKVITKEILLANKLITGDSIVDGPGLRAVVWTQGCIHKCPGCHNPQTHDITQGIPFDVDDLVEVLSKHYRTKKVTFSGGDPFEQPEQCEYIAKGLKERGFNIWAYSGYTYEQILKDEAKKNFLQHIDVLVDGRYLEAQRDLTLAFKGSKNQRIINVQESLKEDKVIIQRVD